MHLRALCIGLLVAPLLAAAAGCRIGNGDEPLLDFGRDCSDHSDCLGYEPALHFTYSADCNAPYCGEDGRCDVRARDSVLADDVRGDCSRPACRSGSRISVTDDRDVPSGDDCRVGVCRGGWSVLQNASDGRRCSRGVCNAGVCVAGPAPDAGSETRDASNDDG